jgi:hypothetical protein
MKSRYDMLTAPSDRRHLAVLRTSSAVGVVLVLMALAIVPPGSPDRGEPAVGDTFGLEMGVPARTPSVDTDTAAAAAVSSVATDRPVVAATDEFAFPSGFELEPLTY